MNDRWAQITRLTFQFDDAPVRERVARIAAARVVVDEGLELFPSGIEPLDDFEGYAMRRVLLALQAVLEE